MMPRFWAYAEALKQLLLAQWLGKFPEFICAQITSVWRKRLGLYLTDLAKRDLQDSKRWPDAGFSKEKG